MADGITTARRTVHPLLAWPTIFTVTVFVAAWLYAFTGRAAFPPWWLAAVAPLIGFAGGARAREVWCSIEYGSRQGDDGVVLSWAAGLSAAAWLVWSGFAGPGRTWSVWALAALALSVWYWAVALRAPRRAAAQAARRNRSEGLAEDRRWRAILDAADCSDVLITDRREHRAGLVLTCEPDPDAVKMPTFDDFAARAKRIGVQAASEARRAGRPLPPNAIRPEPGADDAEFLLNVSTRAVFTESTVYVPDQVPGDIAAPVDLGEYEDGSRIMLSVGAGSAKIVGQSGAGKSNLANVMIARMTGCANALVWVCATDKLIPLVFPWLRSWFEGSAVAPMLDYVAGKRVDEVLRMLRAAYRLCCERNDRLADESKMRASAREPAVFVFVEETSHAVEFTDTIVTHDGQEVTVSDLLKMIAQAGRSANVRIVLLSQYGLNAGLGDRASELMRNLIIRICLKTTEAYDGYRTLPGLPATVDTTAIPLHTMYVQPSIDVARAVPGKSPELDGTARISAIAARQSAWRPVGVEPESDLGPDYAGRWSASRHRELAGAVARAGLSWRDPAGDAHVPVPVPEPVATPQPRETGVTGEWTEATDRAFRDLLSGGAPDAPRPFQLPDAATGVARLRRIVDDMGGETPPEPDEPAACERAEPLPQPLAAVVAWLDGVEDGAVIDVPAPEWYLTSTLAAGIGWADSDVGRLGRELARFGLRSGNLPRGEDAQRRKGFRASEIREVAIRWRFGL